MHVIFSVGSRLRQRSWGVRTLPNLNPTVFNRIVAESAATLAFTVLLAVTAHAQVATSASMAADHAQLNSVPSDYSGATPLEVLNGSAALEGRLAPTQMLRLVLGLQPPHPADEEAFLVDLQNRESPNFHQYLSPEEWNARFAPSAEDEQQVVNWAQSQGLTITNRYANRLIVDVEGTSGTIEKAFAVQMNQYKVGAAVEFSNDRDPVIPSQLAGILQSVGGLNSFQRAHAAHEGNIQETSAIYSPLAESPVGPEMHADGNRAAYEAAVRAARERAGTDKSMKLPAGASNPGGAVAPEVTNGYLDPTDIYSSYGYDFDALQSQGHCCNPLNNSGGTPPATSIGIATAGAFAPSDIVGFQTQYPYLAYHYNYVYVDGTPACCNDETTLDTEWAIATANNFGPYINTSWVWVYEGANSLLSTFTDVYNMMLSDGHVRIFSTSWGCGETTCATAATMNTDHNIFNAMVGQGWTLLADSDDHGATGDCDDALRVGYPGSDPDVISVGGTNLSLFYDGTFYSETAWAGAHWSGACSHNAGGSGGGCSAYFAAPGFQTAQPVPPYCGSGSRSVPDIALNAGNLQNYYFNGFPNYVGGTSIATPEVAGFMAQENAYLLAIGTGCGSGFASTCAPIGMADYQIYGLGSSPWTVTHSPFYDITSGCNSNDITDQYGILNYYCAGTGYDAVTGWGSFNALQLSWAISSLLAGGYSNPTVAFDGPAVSTTSNTWFNTDQEIDWTITANAGGRGGSRPTGIAGYSWQWDAPFSDPTSEAHQGIGNLFYSGPAITNSNTGYTYLSSAGEGCHYLTVYGFDNTGFVTGNTYYYWICYDITAPTLSIATNPPTSQTVWVNKPVTVTVTATDPGDSAASGIRNTSYKPCSNTSGVAHCGVVVVYTAPITVSTPGQGYITFTTEDNAGNATAETQWISIDETAPVTSAALAGSVASGSTYQTAVQVTLNASDAGGSGVQNTFYKLDGGSQVTYSAAFTVSALGSHTVSYWSADNAGNIETAKTVAFSIVSPPAMTSPAPGNTLAGLTTFTWNPGSGSTAFQVYVGTTGAGSHDLYQGPDLAGTVTSSASINIPANGATLYVRLWYVVNSAWLHQDYTYTEKSIPTLTSPSAGTLLGGPTVFTWNPSAGISAYQVYVGTTGTGSSNLYRGPDLPGTTTSSAAVNIPGNGATVYVRLWYEKGTSWFPLDYTYTEATAPSITSPSTSTLLGGATRFTWSPGTGVSEFQLYIGTTGAGSSNIYRGPDLSGTTTSSPSITIPANGATLYVRLWYVRANSWFSQDYAYTEATPPSMSTPAPGSTIGGPTVFTWNPGSSATGFQIYIGTTGAGSGNLYRGPDLPGTATSSSSITITAPSGATLNVRLWYLMNGSWLYQDYTYTAQ